MVPAVPVAVVIVIGIQRGIVWFRRATGGGGNGAVTIEGNGAVTICGFGWELLGLSFAVGADFPVFC